MIIIIIMIIIIKMMIIIMIIVMIMIVLYTASIWGAKNLLYSLLEGISATLNLHIQILDLLRYKAGYLF